MNANRRQFGVGLATAFLGLGLSNKLGGETFTSPSSSGDIAAPFYYFFKDPQLETIILTCLGRSYYSAGNIGKVLYLTRQIKDEDYESAFAAFVGAADEARQSAKESAAAGHKESARQAYLWAQNFYDAATYFVDGSNDPSRFLPTWEALYDCWLAALPFFDPPIEEVRIPYENTELHGFFMRGRSTAKKRPLLILANGSDGSLLDMWLQGAAGALARGYDCLTFDGPGQGYALWKQKLYFRPDWEKVITPVVDYALTRHEVDSKRIAIQGISQGGYWVPRAVAFEQRIAAAIADPGVVNVSTSWTAGLPKPMIQLLNAGRKTEFDGFMAKTMTSSQKAYLNFRMRPYGFTSYFDTFRAVAEYDLSHVVDRIRCPMLITAPAGEKYWPGQSRQLLDLLNSPKQLISFSESDGADLHCEPQGIGLRDLRVFNWLDQTLG